MSDYDEAVLRGRIAEIEAKMRSAESLLPTLKEVLGLAGDPWADWLTVVNRAASWRDEREWLSRYTHAVKCCWDCPCNEDMYRCGLSGESPAQEGVPESCPLLAGPHVLFLEEIEDTDEEGA